MKKRIRVFSDGDAILDPAANLPASTLDDDDADRRARSHAVGGVSLTLTAGCALDGSGDCAARRRAHFVSRRA